MPFSTLSEKMALGENYSVGRIDFLLSPIYRPGKLSAGPESGTGNHGSSGQRLRREKTGSDCYPGRRRLEKRTPAPPGRTLRAELAPVMAGNRNLSGRRG